MKTYNPKHLPKLLILLLCTALIISSNYIFIKKATLDIRNEMIEREYNNNWWKENYLLLIELQKEELINYINKLKTEQPELIYRLKQIAFVEENKDNNKYLSWEALKELKNNSYIKWNTEAQISIIEFSDMECEFCIESHNSWIINNILNNYWKNINYSFKNFPLQKHENGKKEAKAAKCVENISNWEKYLEFIDTVFSNSKNNDFNIEDIPNIINDMWVKQEEFDQCYTSLENNNLVDNEIIQWRKLYIKHTPSYLIINNETWEFQTLEWTSDETLFNDAINTFIKNRK